jgi:hypothetical protein
MDLNDLLMREMSRAHTDFVVNIVLQDNTLFDELWQLFLHGSDPVNRRAAWVIDYVTEARPELLLPHIQELTEALDGFGHDGLVRHSLRMIARSAITDEIAGKLTDFCFRVLLLKEMAIAPKIFAMDILYSISEREPALKRELADSIAYRLDEGTPGYKNHALKLLQLLYKEIDAGKI